ncbi:MAG: hypothetical protein WA828_12095 [Coleofasciculaceae cyanobacterium]
MSSSNDQTRDAAATNLLGLPIPTDFLLSLATGPLLLGVVSLEAVFRGIQTSGINSEEVFRGDRLPLLHFPPADIDD